MANKSSRRSRVSSSGSVSRRDRQKRKLRKREDARPSVFGSLIVQHWNMNLSLADNYKRIGLCHDPNKASLLKISRTQKKRITLPAELGVMDYDSASSDEHVSDTNPIKAQLQDLAANPPRLASPMPKSMPIHEQVMMSALTKKYGDDVDAMARDIKLNRFQKTSAQLRVRLQLYQHLQSL